jgi:uncharacterized protein (TIGR02646 family)
MRRIRKSREPRPLTEWRLRYRGTPNYNYSLLRQNPNVVEAVMMSLLEEQGWLCAYTGRPLDGPQGCHIEHVKAQTHCRAEGRNEDVSYRNMVACYPAPNTGEAPYGAHQKKDWPTPAERHLFVSPLDDNCERRFHFGYNGKVNVAVNGDEAARMTIDRLKLNHDVLKRMRHNAIRGTLQPRNRWLTRDQARKALTRLEGQTNGRLPSFHFATVQALRNHISNLESRAAN